MESRRLCGRKGLSPLGQTPHNAGRHRTSEANGAIIDGMVFPTFNATTTKGQSKVIKTRDGTDVAARYFVYKLYEATDRQPLQWQVLHGYEREAAGTESGVN
jgi:hypothetical protein